MDNTLYELNDAINKAIELNKGEPDYWIYEVVVVIDRENGNHKGIIKAYDENGEYAGRF